MSPLWTVSQNWFPSLETWNVAVFSLFHKLPSSMRMERAIGDLTRNAARCLKHVLGILYLYINLSTRGNWSASVYHLKKLLWATHAWKSKDDLYLCQTTTAIFSNFQVWAKFVAFQWLQFRTELTFNTRERLEQRWLTIFHKTALTFYLNRTHETSEHFTSKDRFASYRDGKVYPELTNHIQSTILPHPRSKRVSWQQQTCQKTWRHI